MRIGLRSRERTKRPYRHLLVIAGLLLGACGTETATTTTAAAVTTTTAGSATSTTDASTTTQASVEPVTLTLVTAWPMTQTSHTGPLLQFIESVEELSEGAITIDVLGGPDTMAPADVHQNLATGSMDLALTSTGYYAETIPEAVVFEATLKSPAEWRELGLFDVANEWHTERLNQLVIGRLGWGQAYALYSAVPITSISDFQGKRFRSSALYNGLMRVLGIEPIAMPPGDIYTGLERGTVDGSAWTDIGATQLSLHEVIEQVIFPPYYNSGIVFNVNLDTWNGLSESQRAIITEAIIVAEEAAPALMEAEKENEAELFETAGVEVFTFEGAEAEQYLEATRQGIRDEFLRRGFTEEQIDDLLSTFE